MTHRSGVSVRSWGGQASLSGPDPHHQRAPVAQWIEREFPKLGAAGSIPARGTEALAVQRLLHRWDQS